MDENLANQLNTIPQHFAANGLSLIIHPCSPKIPTIHLNIRYFELENNKSWFGGGIDLIPYYPLLEDFKYFHTKLKEICESIIPNSYETYKKECDNYFTLIHRNEMRGIGGIFFDYLPANKINEQFTKALGEKFTEIFIPIVEMRKTEPYTPKDKEFQLIRRGRYVEFNLLYDWGTIFGLKSGGDIESILISLPPEVKFEYKYEPQNGTPQAEMLNYYQPRDWAD
jgi:coproporphyrinogen III oxidase